MTTDIRELFGRLWLPQLILVLTLVIYSSLLTLGVGLAVTQPTLFFPNTSPPSNNSPTMFDVVIMFESSNTDHPITWDPVVAETNHSETLLSVMNRTVSLSLRHHTGMGYFVEGINGVEVIGSNYWVYYSYVRGEGWVQPPVGAGSFQINSNTYFLWSFGPVG